MHIFRRFGWKINILYLMITLSLARSLTHSRKWKTKSMKSQNLCHVDSVLLLLLLLLLLFFSYVREQLHWESSSISFVHIMYDVRKPSYYYYTNFRERKIAFKYQLRIEYEWRRRGSRWNNNKQRFINTHVCGVLYVHITLHTMCKN